MLSDRVIYYLIALGIVVVLASQSFVLAANFWPCPFGGK